MEVVADLQIHSKYARATSKDLSLANLEKYARIKGITLSGTGDFQHPEHRKEIDACLKEDDKGVLWSKTGFDGEYGVIQLSGSPPSNKPAATQPKKISCAEEHGRFCLTAEAKQLK